MRRIGLVVLPDSGTTSQELKSFFQECPLESFENQSFSFAISSLGIDLLIPSSPSPPAAQISPKKPSQSQWLIRPENWHLLGPQGSIEDLPMIDKLSAQVRSLYLLFLARSADEF
jgi:hypothetical protein